MSKPGPLPAPTSESQPSPAQQLWQLWQAGGSPDVHAFLARAPELNPLQLLAVLRIDQQQRWQRGQRVLVEDYLEHMPRLRGDEELTLDLIHSEVLVREEQGEQPELQEYQGRFPAYSASLARLFAVHRALGASLADPHTVAPSGTAGGPPAEGETWQTQHDRGPVDGLPATLSYSGPAAGEIGPGTVVAGYELLAVLGRGGMGVVYRARQTSLQRIVALKMIRTGSLADSEELARFRSEAQDTARLHHANIVQIHEVGEYQGHAYFSLELVAGGTLAGRLAAGPLSAPQAAELVEILARAAHHAHLCGIVHRDLKPTNVLLTPEGTPKIADFGLAKRVDQRSGQTVSGQILGTPCYMAPEQASGRIQQIGPATDVYALGAILYETLTGRPPFRGETTLETLEQVRCQEPVPPRRLRGQLPRDLETICLTCLAKDPRRRYASALELAEDLRRFQAGEPIHARPTPAWERALKWVRRRPAVAGLVVVSGLALLTLVVGIVMHNLRLQDALQETQEQRDQATQAHAEARKQLEQARHSLYALQLERVAAAAERDPGHGLHLLADAERCPPDLRDFTWGFLYQCCRRDWTHFQGHDDGVRTVAVSPDGQILASAGGDQTVKLWSLASGKVLGTLRGHTAPVNALAFAPRGGLLVSAGEDGAVRFWDPLTRAPQTTVHRHQGAVNALAFSPDGSVLATAGTDQTVRLWSVADGKEQQVLRGHSDSVFGLAFSPDGRRVATASKDGTARLWECSTGREQQRLRGHRTWVTAVAFSPDGRVLASGGIDWAIKLWDLETGKERTTLVAHRGPIGGLAFSPDGKSLLSASYDHTLRVWEAFSGHEQLVLKGHQGAIPAAVFLSNGQQAVSASLDRTVRLWDLTSVRAGADLRGHTRPLTSVAFSPDGQLLASGGYDQVLRLWDVATHKEQAALSGHDDWISCLTFSPDGQEVACGDGSGSVKLWNVARRSSRLTLQADAMWVTDLAYTPDGKTLLTAGGTEALIRFWDVKTGVEKTPLAAPGEVLAMALDPRGKWLAGGSAAGKVWVWDLATREEHGTLEGHQGEIRALAFSSDGRSLASAGVDGLARLWDVETGKERAVLNGHAGAVHAVAFTADGKTVASGSADGTVKLWDAVTGHERATLMRHRGEVSALAFQPAGQVLASVGADTTVRLWIAGEP